MRLFTDAETKRWCESLGIQVSADRYLHFAADHGSHSFTIEPATKPEHLIHFSNLFLDVDETGKFKGAMLWFREWGIWNEVCEELGWKTIELLRASYGMMGPPQDKPGQSFDPDEMRECQAFTIEPMLIGWDAFLVSGSGDYFVFISHDSFYKVVSRNAAVDAKLFTDFATADPHRRHPYP